MNTKPDSKLLLANSMRRHAVVALGSAMLLVGVVGGWASLTEISGAVVASGRLVVDTHTKPIQHQAGGTIQDILVRDGDIVKPDELLVRLDDTVARANLSAIEEQLAELNARKARLTAERDGLEAIDFDAIEPIPEDVQNGQSNLLAARRKARDEQTLQLGEQIDQFERQLEGVASQTDANDRQLELIAEELEGLLTLLEKQLVPKNRVIALQRDEARLMGVAGELTAQSARLEEAISERKSQMVQLEQDWRAEVLENLQSVSIEITDLHQQRTAAQYQLTNSEIRAPQEGLIHELNVFGEGGVVAPGETLMQIVPREDLLVVSAQVRPVDIDQIRPGQEARVRLPSFNQRVTPELTAKVSTVSADLVEDKRSGEFHYDVVLTISKDQRDRLNGKEILPGMPVEVFVKTDNRTVLSYLMKPVRDQIVHAMRES